MLPRLGYWNTRTLGQPIRMLLVYTGTDFEDHRHCVGDPPGYDMTNWTAVKDKLGLDFPNLPYFIDGDIKLSQSVAILRYIGRKHDLCGRTEEERIRLDMLINRAMDFGAALWDICYRHLDRKEEYIKELPEKLQEFSDFLGDKPWFISRDEVTIAEFVMYEFLYHHTLVAPSCLQNFPRLSGFMQRFCDIPSIKEYMASPLWLPGPIFNIFSQYEEDRRKRMKEKGE